MVRNNILKPKASISDYKKTIEEHLPFALIRCAKYTNSKHIAEIISIYAFICTYLLTEALDGSNKIELLIDNMIGVAGKDLGNGSDTLVNGPLLFEGEEVLSAVRILSEMDGKDCLAKVRLRMDYLDCFFDRKQLDRITATIIDFLENKRGLTGKCR